MKTLGEMKAAGLRDLAAITHADVQRARLEETAIDLLDDHGVERGFVVQGVPRGHHSGGVLLHRAAPRDPLRRRDRSSRRCPVDAFPQSNP